MFYIRGFKRRFHKNIGKEYNKGYDYAAGALLRKEETPKSILSCIDADIGDPFDAGCKDAIALLIEKGVIKDDSE